MSLISKYVREQKRYTKEELKNLFHYDEDGISAFIKALKSYGVLKSVKNNAAQLELSDLTDDDIEITDGSELNGSCLYVFSFVGVITYRDRIIKSYPKYMLSIGNDDDPLDRMQQIVKVLEKYNKSEDQIINLYNGSGDSRSFNLLSVILFLMRDYFEYGVYTNSDDIVEINGEGDIMWEKTIDEGFAVMSDGRPYYTEVFTRRTIDDDTDYFKMLHEFVITDCSKQLRAAQLDYLFGVETEILSSFTLTDFGDVEYVLEKIVKELSVQFNTRKQILLKTIYAYISYGKRLLDDSFGFSMYGTNTFHTIWEKMCSEVFDNKLDRTLRELKLLNSSGAESYNFSYDFVWDGKLIEVIKKPIWENKAKGICYEASDTLIPDLITIPIINGERYFVILDAKYYNLKLERESKLKGNPGVGDVTKQYLYQLAYKDLISCAGIKNIINCFLMPTEKDTIINYGVARMPILEGLGLENIQILLIPGHKIAECYLSNKKMSIDKDLKLV